PRRLKTRTLPYGRPAGPGCSTLMRLIRRQYKRRCARFAAILASERNATPVLSTLTTPVLSLSKHELCRSVGRDRCHPPCDRLRATVGGRRAALRRLGHLRQVHFPAERVPDDDIKIVMDGCPAQRLPQLVGRRHHARGIARPARRQLDGKIAA